MTTQHHYSAGATLACILALLSAAGPAAARKLHGFGVSPPSPPHRPLSTWQEAPGKLSTHLSSCSWTGNQCQSSMAPVLSASHSFIDSANYPAWALANILSTDLYCTQYSKGQCAWPCEYEEGVGCRMDGHLYYNVWNCEDSIAAEDNYCGQEPQTRSKASCLSNPACSWSAAEDPAERCMSTFASNLTSNQRLYVFGNLYYNVRPRELWGCCKGSTYAYQLDNWCDAAFNNVTGEATKESCLAVPGCIWDQSASDVCVPSPQTKVQLQFAYKPADPLAPVLTKLARECAAITDAKKCASYKPVKVDVSKVQTYMSRDLLNALNLPVSNTTCPLPSVPPPWVH